MISLVAQMQMGNLSRIDQFTEECERAASIHQAPSRMARWRFWKVLGTYHLAVYPITTAQGHILINTGINDSAPVIKSNDLKPS